MGLNKSPARLPVALALLALLAVVLVVALWPVFMSEPATGPAQAGGNHPQQAGGAPLTPRQPLQQPDEPATVNPGPAPALLIGARFRVTCRNGSAAVTGVPVTIRVFENAAGRTHEKEATETSNELGEVAFEVEGTVGALLVSVDTPQWYCAQPLSVTDFRLSDETGERVAVLALLPRARVFVDVKHDDDIPFEGTVGFSGAGWQKTITIRQGRGEVPDMPVADLVCYVRPERPGFTMLYENIDKARITGDAVLMLVLGTSKWPRSGLEVMIPKVIERYGDEGAMKLTLRVVDEDRGFVISSGRVPGHPSGDFRWKNYELAPGTYTVTSTCGDLVARTVVVLAVNEVSKVELNLEQGATLVAVIVGEHDQPLKGAALRYTGGPYTVFPARTDPNNRLVVSNAQGVATLRAVAPVPQTLLIEAEGYDVFTLEIAPVARVSTEVRCKLVPATGRLVITLENGVPGGKYLVSYLHPYTSMGNYQDIEVAPGQELVIERLPCRKYSVVAFGKAGTGVAQKVVDLASPDFDGRVTLDVSALTPLEK